MQADIERVLIDRHSIARRIKQLAQVITDDLRAESNSITAEITLVPILTGSVIFVADLIRQLPLKMQIRVMSVSSYPDTVTISRGAIVEAALTKVPDTLTGRHVLIIDDILDSGRTLRLVTDLLRAKQPTSLRSCVLLRKHRLSALNFPVDYVAFDISDHFVVGYGLDFDNYYRNIPDIVTLRSEVTRNDGSTESRPGHHRTGLPR